MVANYIGLYCADTPDGPSYSGSHTFATDGIVFSFSNYSSPPTVDGAPMQLVKAQGGQYLYSLPVKAGTHTLAIGGGNNKNFVFAPGADTVGGVWSASAGALAITPGGAGVVGSFVWTQGPNTSGYFVTQPTGFSELQEARSVGSGGDWGHGTEASYKIGATPGTITPTGLGDSTQHIAVETITLLSSGNSVSVVNEVGVAI